MTAPDTGKPDPLDEILVLLNARVFGRAITLLEQLTRDQPHRAAVHFNLGLALSETHQFPEAVISLKRSTDLDPKHAPSWTGLGVAYWRLHKFSEARQALERSLALDPKDGVANLNMAATLSELHDHEPALRHARDAAVLLGYSESSHFMLAEAMRNWACDFTFDGESKDLLAQSDSAYETFMDIFPRSVLIERAEKARTIIAGIFLKDRGVGGFRPDVVQYILGALRRFDAIGPAARNRAVLEIAKIGADGLNIDSSVRKFALSTLDGEFTALHLVSILYAGMKQADPTVDAGIDFSREYAAAVALHSGR